METDSILFFNSSTNFCSITNLGSMNGVLLYIPITFLLSETLIVINKSLLNCGPNFNGFPSRSLGNSKSFKSTPIKFILFLVNKPKFSFG